MARLVRRLSDIVEGETMYAHRADMSAVVDAVAERGGVLWGYPESVRGGYVAGCGHVLPAPSAGLEPHEGEAELAELLSLLQELSGGRGRPATCASAALRACGLTDRTSPEGLADDMARDAVYCGPIETFRVSTEPEPLVYIDQQSAYLRAIERGIPLGIWRHVPKPILGNCNIIDATIDVREPCVPMRVHKWGGVAHYVGVVRVVVPSQYLELPGVRVVRIHSCITSPRIKVSRYTARVRAMMRSGGLAKRVAKSSYQKLWGRLLFTGGLDGVVTDAPVKGAHAHSTECGRLVAWTRADSEPDTYRPDVAAEILANCAIETWMQAREFGDRVMMMHIDGMIIRGESMSGIRAGWAPKAIGVGRVYGQGRYEFASGESGRMGMDESDSFELSRGDSRRDWSSWPSSGPIDMTGAQSWRTSN